ncbi:MAG: hypothetical protein RJA22_2369 [Verrucomicrobiota bacterium]
MHMPRRASLAALLLALPALPAGAAEPPAGQPAGYRLLYEQDCRRPESLADFVFSDPKAWKWNGPGENAGLELAGKSQYKPAHRSPLNIALIADRTFGDFTLEAELQSTVKPYNHQDMCLFYGFAGTNQFYYTHLAVAADPHAHNIFIVTNAARLAIARQTTRGVQWGDGRWHKIRLERRAAEGSIKVYFDDLTQPIMVAEEKTLTRGAIGFGSFDDRGRVRNIRVWGPAVTPEKTGFFRRQGD